METRGKGEEGRRWEGGGEERRRIGKAKKVKDRECLSPDEEVPSKTVILGFLWGTE